jgi:hypothetical protein
MPSNDVYARCNFTLSGNPAVRFNLVIKFSQAMLEEARQRAENRELSERQLLARLVRNVVPVLYPQPGASFSVGCDPLPEGEIPREIEGRTDDGTQFGELTYWSV